MSNATIVPKGITALIYRDALGADFSNQGISSRVMEVTVIGEGIDPVVEATEERPAVRVVKKENLHRETVIHAEPVTQDDDPAQGPRRPPAARGKPVFALTWADPVLAAW